MDEKTIQRIKKLQALAERGVGGEKTTAQKKLAKLLKDNGINSLDELQKEEYEYTIFSYNGKHEIKLLRQCMYKVMGAKSDRTAYKPYGRRQKIGIYCTKAQKIEIELEFEFYRNVFYEELSTFMDAFIQAQQIFPERTVQAMGWRSGRIGAESRRCLIMQNRRAYPLQTLICSWAFYGKNCRDTQQ